MTTLTPARWCAGDRFAIPHHDGELDEDTLIRGVVVSVNELDRSAFVRIDGVPCETWVPFELLEPAQPERTAA